MVSRVYPGTESVTRRGPIVALAGGSRDDRRIMGKPSVRLRVCFASVVAVSAALGARDARAATTEVGPGDDIEAAMNALAPGDELVLRGGTYEPSGRFGLSIAGTEAQPILIRAKDGERPHITRADADQNLVDV